LTLRYMLDTNICIFVLRGRGGRKLTSRFETEASLICISSVTLAELSYGVAKSAQPERNAAALAGFVARLPVLDFDTAAAETFGPLRASLQRAGTPIGPYDLMIGAHAASRDLAVVTNNRREFDRVEGLRVEDWSA
jgi:tRNA(fMet)-specific endonuclease VapC